MKKLEKQSFVYNPSDYANLAEALMKPTPRKQRNVQYSPVVPPDRRSRHIIVKDKDDPVSTIGASLQGDIIVVHWADGFASTEVQTLLMVWWPAATEMRYD